MSGRQQEHIVERWRAHGERLRVQSCRRQSHGHNADGGRAVGGGDGDAAAALGDGIDLRQGLSHRRSRRNGIGGKVDDDHVGAHSPLQLRGRALLDDAAVVDDGHPVRQGIGLLEILSGEKHRHPQLGVQPAHLVPHLRPADRIEAGGGLVQEENFGPVYQRGGQVEAASHAAAVGLDTGIHGVADISEVHCPRYGGGAVGRAQPVQAGLEIQYLPAGLAFVERRFLQGDADANANRSRIGNDVVAGHRGPPRGGLQQGAQHPHRGALASAVGTEKSIDLAGVDC